MVQSKSGSGRPSPLVSTVQNILAEDRIWCGSSPRSGRPVPSSTTGDRADDEKRFLSRGYGLGKGVIRR